ncbi:hypothetical protein SAM23877_p126 (plasmid) [Streptomyces ambofaciens ATCC 23877]|uniref:Uncharacterized protein n=1 Tax=Streptomyces ambofaciens (strain ATCC 23877 / 3486 / DSM 40053 / JCM 4204 / NBRC 12836 / NRRL B-2516) TaxID=278992 RepID=A0A0K2B610_STRA7|nr:hypothetical protein [Streptomyces ambofaciens]AKZ60835.1 hypothetical protein SAM23877_p126 [Streptomyces ambofaciens ATCC 23877]
MTDQPTEPQAHHLRIDAQPGHATIRIEGEALPSGTVTGYTLQHDIAGGLPLAVLHTRQPDGLVFEGLARVAVGIPDTPGDIVAAFLAQLDPAELENAALNRDDLGNNQYDLTRAMLRQAADWARGEH